MVNCKLKYFLRFFVFGFLFLTGKIGAQVLTSDSLDQFVVVKEAQANQYALKSILATGEVFSITNVSKSNAINVEVILPYLYIHDKQNNDLKIYDSRGNRILIVSNCLGFSANHLGILIQNVQNQLRVFSIKDKKLLETPEPLLNVSKFKISDNVILIFRDQSKTVETYNLNASRQNYYPVVTQGWSQLNNLSSVSFNKNFMINKDWQQIAKVTNVQGNSINLGRGALKSSYLTKNHYIAYYGNDKVEVFNAFEKQFILTLPQVYTIKSSNYFTSFKWDTEITILNEQGEIFTLPTNPQTKFSHGESNYSLSEGDKIFIYNSSGEKIFDKKIVNLVHHHFLGDFLCAGQKNTQQQQCFNSKIPQIVISNVLFSMDAFNVGVSNWGFYQFDNDKNELEVHLNNGKQITLNQIYNVYNPLSSTKNEHAVLSF